MFSIWISKGVFPQPLLSSCSNTHPGYGEPHETQTANFVSSQAFTAQFFFPSLDAYSCIGPVSRWYGPRNPTSPGSRPQIAAVATRKRSHFPSAAFLIETQIQAQTFSLLRYPEKIRAKGIIIIIKEQRKSRYLFFPFLRSIFFFFNFSVTLLLGIYLPTSKFYSFLNSFRRSFTFYAALL